MSVKTLPTTGGQFDLIDYLATLDKDLLELVEEPGFAGSEARRLLTRLSPMAFAAMYLSKHITDEEDGSVSFADPHLDWTRLAQQWIRPIKTPKEWRHVFVAPRSCAKTTWWYLIVPMWAAAHGWAKFIAAFADSANQATTHLLTFKHELDTNELLRADYPDLCRPAKRPSGASESDTQAMYIAASGFAIAARGIDSAALGLKVGRRRPDVLILDDVEPDESSYSEYQRNKRLRTIIDAVLALNEKARVVLVGTVTMSGSIIHQTVKAARGETPESWIEEERFVCHHYQPLVTNPDGTERSIWPHKWPLDYLLSIRHTRSYKKNFANDPAGSGGAYWTEQDIPHAPLVGVTRTLLSVDPGLTTEKKNDPTGLAVVGWAPPRKVAAEELARAETAAQRRELIAARDTGRCAVHAAWEVRLIGEDLRTAVLRACEQWPEIRLILVESNQGGEHWRSILHDMPAKVVTVHNSEPKEVRAADLLHHYQMGAVTHSERLPAVEEQMCGFPAVAHDDMVDAVGTGVFKFIPPASRKSRPVVANIQTSAYV